MSQVVQRCGIPIKWMDAYNMNNKMNIATTMNIDECLNGLTNYSMWNMWINDRNIGLWTLLLSLGVQRDFMSNCGSRYPGIQTLYQLETV